MLSTTVSAQDDGANPAKQLANPVPSLISLPIQANYDTNIGPREEGSVGRVNIQPVIPFSLNDDWNLISRTILPLISQDDIPLTGQGESGIGDVVQSFFFSPKAPTGSGWIWGAVLANETGKRRHDMNKSGNGYDAFLEWLRADDEDKINEPRMVKAVWAKVVENADRYYQQGQSTDELTSDRARPAIAHHPYVVKHFGYKFGYKSEPARN